MYFKELARKVMKAQQVQSPQEGWQAGDPGKSLSSNAKVVCWPNSLLFQGSPSFFY